MRGARMARCVVVYLGIFLGRISSAAAEDGEPTATGKRSAALEVVEAQARSAFEDVEHTSTRSLEALLRVAPDRVVLLDVRGADEFAVSRLAGAVQVAPDTRSAAEIVKLTGDLNGKSVVAYCSICRRSSRLLVRIGQALRESGASELYNLAGGRFRWRNEQLPLVGPDGPTCAIHPNNVLWRQFLIDDPGSTLARE